MKSFTISLVLLAALSRPAAELFASSSLADSWTMAGAPLSASISPYPVFCFLGSVRLHPK